MGYYTGDYARGDYYTGDPGIFGAIAHVVGGAIGGFVSRGPVGGILGAIGGTISGAKAGMQPAILAAGGSESAYTPAMRAKHKEIMLRGGAGYLQSGGLRGGQVGPPMSAAAAAQLAFPAPGARRVHPNKTTYVVRGGGTSRYGPAGQLVVIPKGTTLVPSRRMNVGNARALRRGLRRLRGFAKLAHKVIRIQRQFKHAGPVRGLRRRR